MYLNRRWMRSRTEREKNCRFEGSFNGGRGGGSKREAKREGTVESKGNLHIDLKVHSKNFNAHVLNHPPFSVETDFFFYCIGCFSLPTIITQETLQPI